MKWQFFLCLVVVVQSCNNPSSVKGAEPVTVPFELTSHNNISIKAILNQLDTLDLMFHTAASDLSLTTEATKRIESISWSGEHDVTTWGGNAEARFSENNSLRIGQLTWDSLEIWESENSGPGTGGKFGPNLFEGKAIEIDFSQKMMLIHDSLPIGLGSYIKVPLVFEDDMMFIEGVSTINGEEYVNRFLIHSGYGGAVLYDDAFSLESRISEYIEITDEQELRDSYGNVLKTLKGTLPSFSLAGLEFENVTVGFFEGSIGRQQMSVIGGGLLKRFDLVIDQKREFIYMKSV
jgi:hypothetical protein